MNIKKKSIVIGLTSLLLVTLLLLGLTYAYYKTKIVGNTNEKSVSVVSKKLEVTYQNESAVINAEGIEPGYTNITEPKTFEVKNTGSETVEYSVMLDNVTNTFTRTQDWTYTISENGTELKSGTLPNTTSYILYSESIAAGETKNYTLVINYANLEDVNQSEDMGKSLSFRINISNSLGTTLTSASEGTLLYAINRDNVVSEPLTIPGQQASTSGEAILATTEDNYGTSYYFRGNVTNNYVNYSGMCWRIVRVQGNGTIKLILANSQYECNAENYNIDSTTTDVLDMSVGSSYFLTVNSIQFDSWVNNNINDRTKLVESLWCFDNTLSSMAVYEEGNPLTGEAFTYYKFTGSSRSLKCDHQGINNTSSTLFSSYSSALTLEEAEFAGAAYNTSSTYLSDDTFWGFILNKQYDGDTIGWGVPTGFLLDKTGNINTDYDIYSGASTRPLIVLNSNVVISSGNGTQTNPYVIN